MALGDSGGVKTGELEPKIAIVGRFNAAAMCIKPESFVTTTELKLIIEIASFKLVFPHKLIVLLPLIPSILSPKFSSAFEPNIMTKKPLF